MHIIDPGHFYTVRDFNVDGTPCESYRQVVFHKAGENGYPGTSTQEVLRIVSDRLHSLNLRSPSLKNRIVIALISLALKVLGMERYLPTSPTTSENILVNGEI